MLKPIFAAFITTSLIVLAAACSQADLSGGDGGVCIAGKACDCVEETCTQTCGDDDGGCSFQCGEGQDCSFSCPGGSCAVECNNSASCELDCGGDNCDLNCNGTDECRLKGCDNACVVDCGDAATCTSSCDLLSGCVVNG